jgi:hypothetical protein
MDLLFGRSMLLLIFSQRQMNGGYDESMDHCLATFLECHACCGSESYDG